MAGWHHNDTIWKEKECPVCVGVFTPRSGSHKFCSRVCKRKQARTQGSETTDAQYRLVSGNWGKYFGRLCAQKNRRGVITREDCLAMLSAQNGLCALSGVPLTCILTKGEHTTTNASLDRVDPKGAYHANNVQLVCVALNRFRVDTSLPEFVEWCRKVSDHAAKR
jgi:hypothetical protein